MQKKISEKLKLELAEAKLNLQQAAAAAVAAASTAPASDGRLRHPIQTTKVETEDLQGTATNDTKTLPANVPQATTCSAKASAAWSRKNESSEHLIRCRLT
eukprot:SAG31_NODE_9587_length_1255_cov_0.836505_1_plen_100_part_10